MTTVKTKFSANPYPGVKVRVFVEVEVPPDYEIIHVTEACILNWFWNRAIGKTDTLDKLGEYLIIQKPDGTYFDEDKTKEHTFSSGQRDRDQAGGTPPAPSPTVHDSSEGTKP